MGLFLIVGIVVLIGVAAVLFIVLKKQSKHKKLLKYFQKEYLNILRVDALNRSIISPLDPGTSSSGPRKILVQVKEKSELIEKTYLLDMKSPWVIGRKPGDNAICIIGDKTVSSVHCMLKAQDNKLYLVDMGSKNSTLYVPAKGPYSKSGVCLPQKGAQQLTTGDSFIVGFTSFQVTIYDSSIGII